MNDDERLIGNHGGQPAPDPQSAEYRSPLVGADWPARDREKETVEQWLDFVGRSAKAGLLRERRDRS